MVTLLIAFAAVVVVLCVVGFLFDLCDPDGWITILCVVFLVVPFMCLREVWEWAFGRRVYEQELRPSDSPGANAVARAMVTQWEQAHAATEAAVEQRRLAAQVRAEPTPAAAPVPPPPPAPKRSALVEGERNLEL